MQPFDFVSTYQSILNQFTLLIRTIPLIYLQIAVLISWVALFLSLRPLLKHKQKLSILILFILLGIAGCLLVLKYNTLNKYYIVTSQEKNAILSGPGKDYTVLGHLPKGAELVKIDQVGPFIKVSWNGKIFWIGQDHVKE